MEQNMENLKYLVLGFRKYTGSTQREIAHELGIPVGIVDALETGTYKHPSKKLLDKIELLTGKFEFEKDQYINLGRGYRIKEVLGPDFKYFLHGLERLNYISQDELESMSKEECYQTIGSIKMDEFEVSRAGRAV